MPEPESREKLIELLAEALQLADELRLAGVGISIDRALSQLDENNDVLRDSARRLWELPPGPANEP